MPPRYTDEFKEAHEIVHMLEDKIKDEMPFVEKVIIHFE